jgi:hypothetical protein
MNVECTLKIDFRNPDEVKMIVNSVKVDDFDFVKTSISENTLVAEIKSKSITSLLHTLDDYIACVSVASKIIDEK